MLAPEAMKLSQHESLVGQFWVLGFFLPQRGIEDNDISNT